MNTTPTTNTDINRSAHRFQTFYFASTFEIDTSSKHKPSYHKQTPSSWHLNVYISINYKWKNTFRGTFSPTCSVLNEKKMYQTTSACLIAGCWIPTSKRTSCKRCVCMCHSFTGCKQPLFLCIIHYTCHASVDTCHSFTGCKLHLFLCIIHCKCLPVWYLSFRHTQAPSRQTSEKHACNVPNDNFPQAMNEKHKYRVF